MVQRIFGPVRGAGVQITELEGQKTIEPGALGFVGYAGVFEKGPTGELITLLSKTAAKKKIGGRITDSLVPDAIDDYFSLAAGAGGVLAIRVTDGNEQAADGYKNFARTATIANVYARRVLQTPIAKVAAKNGGRWGGKQSYYRDEFALLGDLTATTLDTGLSKFTTDEWKGGYIELDAVANVRYPILGNTAAGVITVASDATMAADLAASAAPTNFVYYLVLDKDSNKQVSVEFRDGEELPDSEFSM